MNSFAIDVHTEHRKVDTVAVLTFYVVLLMGIPARLVFSPLGAVGQPATVLGVCFLGWYLLAWLHPASTLDRGRQPIRLFAVLWFCAIIAAYVSATRHTMPVLELNSADRGVIEACALLGIALLTADGIDSMDRLRTLVRRIVLGATAMAALGMAQFFTGLDAAKYIIIPGLTANEPYTDLIGRDSFNRPSATALHPIEFGLVLSLCLPLAIHQARYAPPRLRTRRWLQVALIAATLPMTVSRSAILGLVVVGIVILPTWPKRDRRLAYFVVISSALVMQAAIPGLLATLRHLFLGAANDASAQERAGAFSLAEPLISQHPWFGMGFETLLPQNYFFTDDQYLSILIETGVVGLLALLALFSAGWFLSQSVRRMTHDDELRHLAQCLAASVAVVVVAYASLDALGYPMASGLTFLLLGCIGAMWRLTRVEASLLATRVRAPLKSAVVSPSNLR